MTRRDDITKEQLEEYFFEDALSVRQVAKKYSCCTVTIRQRLKKYGIELDPDIWYRGSSRHQRTLRLQRTKLTPRQVSILIGCILGDGYIDKGTIDARLEFWQKSSRKGYVKWLQKELQPFAPHQGRMSTSITNGIKRLHAYIYTVRNPEFTRFRNMFYPNGKKIIPKNIGDYLDELALTVWYEGDGNTQPHNSKIHTQGFTIPECKLLLKVLHKKFDIKGEVRMWGGTKENKLPILFFGSRSGAHKRLHEIIDPLVHKDFEYKKHIP